MGTKRRDIKDYFHPVIHCTELQAHVGNGAEKCQANQ